MTQFGESRILDGPTIGLHLRTRRRTQGARVGAGRRSRLGDARCHASIEYKRGQWFDVVSELLVGRTRQTDDLDSTEVTPRIGLRLHLLSNLRDELGREGR